MNGKKKYNPFIHDITLSDLEREEALSYVQEVTGAELSERRFTNWRIEELRGQLNNTQAKEDRWPSRKSR